MYEYYPTLYKHNRLKQIVANLFDSWAIVDMKQY